MSTITERGKRLMLLGEETKTLKGELQKLLDGGKLSEQHQQLIQGRVNLLKQTESSVGSTWDITKTRAYWSCKEIYTRVTGKDWIDA